MNLVNNLLALVMALFITLKRVPWYMGRRRCHYQLSKLRKWATIFTSFRRFSLARYAINKMVTTALIMIAPDCAAVNIPLLVPRVTAAAGIPS